MNWYKAIGGASEDLGQITSFLQQTLVLQLGLSGLMLFIALMLFMLQTSSKSLLGFPLDSWGTRKGAQLLWGGQMLALYCSFLQALDLVRIHHPLQSWWVPKTQLLFETDVVLFSTMQAEESQPFLFTIEGVSVFFLLMSQLILLLTQQAFSAGHLDERDFIHGEEARILVTHARQNTQLTFSVALAVLQLLLVLFFSTQNFILFFITFEASSLAIFFIMGFFGKRSQKFRALSYLFYFTLLSAVPLLLVILWGFWAAGETDLNALLETFGTSANFSRPVAILGFLACFLPFGVKVAWFPLHTWLPEAHVEASTEGSMLLSGIMLKLGIFGIARVAIMLFPTAFYDVAPMLATCALVGAFIAALSTYRQLDVKKIIAYSSVVHMNLALVGIFSISSVGFQAALFMSFSHALISAGLFYAIGVLQERTKTRNLLELSGLWVTMPHWSAFFGILLLANAGMPGTVGFIAEGPLLWGIFTYLPYTALLTLVPTALMSFRCFLLFTQLCAGVPHTYLQSGFLHGTQLSTKEKRTTPDLALGRLWDVSIRGEGGLLFFFVLSVLFFGVSPQLMLSLLQPFSNWQETMLTTFEVAGYPSIRAIHEPLYGEDRIREILSVRDELLQKWSFLETHPGSPNAVPNPRYQPWNAHRVSEEEVNWMWENRSDKLRVLEKGGLAPTFAANFDIEQENELEYRRFILRFMEAGDNIQHITVTPESLAKIRLERANKIAGVDFSTWDPENSPKN